MGGTLGKKGVVVVVVGGGGVSGGGGGVSGARAGKVGRACKPAQATRGRTNHRKLCFFMGDYSVVSKRY